MNRFREIRLNGNRQAIDTKTGEMLGQLGTNIIQCWDGFRFSVLAGPGVYCRPRPELLVGDDYPLGLGRVAGTYPGPYTHVEVGFWNGKLPKPWKAWRPYCEGLPDRRFIVGQTTVFPFVPASMVYDLIRRHGGEVPVVGERAYGRERVIRNRRRQLRCMENMLTSLTNDVRSAAWPGGPDAARWVPEMSDGA